MRRKRRIYTFDSQEFLSKAEIKCYRFLKSKYPGIRIDANTPVGIYFIDFKIELPNEVFFLEFHPIRKRVETYRSYYWRRRKILDEHGYATNRLFVVTSLKRLQTAKLPLIILQPDIINNRPL